MDAARPNPGEKQGFSRGSRLRLRSDFLAVQQAAGGRDGSKGNQGNQGNQGSQGRKIPGTHFLLLARARPAGSAGEAPRTRLGLTVSRKVGNAVERNRVKRWLRESYRRLSGFVPVGTDLVLIARTGAAQGSFRSTSTELGALLRRLRT